MNIFYLIISFTSFILGFGISYIYFQNPSIEEIMSYQIKAPVPVYGCEVEVCYIESIEPLIRGQ